MLAEGQGLLFSQTLSDGPLPAHYEPAESPVPNLLYPKASYNPISQRWYDNFADLGDKNYPYIMTTYRITEHYQSGIVTRNMPWLNEMMPELLWNLTKTCETLGIKNGDTVRIESKRLLHDGKQDGIEARPASPGGSSRW